MPLLPIRSGRQTPGAAWEIAHRDGARRRVPTSLTCGAIDVQHRPYTCSGGVGTFTRGYIRELHGVRAPENTDDWISTGRKPRRRLLSAKSAQIDRRITLSLSGKARCTTYAKRKYGMRTAESSLALRRGVRQDTVKIRHKTERKG